MATGGFRDLLVVLVPKYCVLQALMEKVESSLIFIGSGLVYSPTVAGPPLHPDRLLYNSIFWS